MIDYILYAVFSIKETFTSILSTIFFPFTFIYYKVKSFILFLLFFVDSYVHNQALSIFITFIVIRLALLPLVISKLKSAQKLKKLEPEINRIKEKMKGLEGLDAELFKIYRANNVNPVAGLLSLMIELPFSVAFFAIAGGGDFFVEGSKFLIWDLTKPDGTNIFRVSNALLMIFGNPNSSRDISTGKKGDMQTMMTFFGLSIFFFSGNWRLASHLAMIIRTAFELAQDKVVEYFFMERD